MKKNTDNAKSSSALPVILYIAGVLLFFVLVLVIPQSREVYKQLSSTHPFLCGFAKFALLAFAGELIAAKMSSGSFGFPKYSLARFVIWGIIGIWITFMMKMFSVGVAQLMAGGVLPGGDNFFLRALYISVVMNICFGPTFMAVHKCSDTYLALRAKGERKIGINGVIDAVDWKRFVTFTLFKTIPIFWIPMHTLTFMLPAEYQVTAAAFLSLALGIIMNIRKKPKTK